MSSTIDPQSDLPHEELVAYLDGELPPEDCRRIEERLATDTGYRQQLRELDQAWEALDALPPATADDNFARTTIEMVAIAAERDFSKQAVDATAANRNRVWLWAAGGVAAAVVGFAGVRTLLPDANDRLLAELPVIRQFDHLSQIDDVEFLRTLPNVVPMEQLAHDPAAIERELAELESAMSLAPEARRQWLESLSPNEKANLTAQAKRFDDLAQRNPQKEKRLRDMEREIAQHPAADQLLKAMVTYSTWLAHRSPGEQEDLRVSPGDERLEEIKRIVRRADEEAARHLSADDASSLRDEIYAIYNDRASDFRKAMRRRDRDNRPFLEGPPPRLALMVVHWELNNDDRDDKTTERLIGALSQEAQEYWKTMRHRRHDRRRSQRLQLLQWVSEAMRPRWGPDVLEQFFIEELDTDQRQRLLSLPRDEMQAQLERLFVEKRLGLRRTGEWPGEFGEAGPFQREPGRGRPDGRSRDRGRVEPSTDSPRGPRDDDGPGRRPPDRPAPPPPSDAPPAETAAAEPPEAN